MGFLGASGPYLAIGNQHSYSDVCMLASGGGEEALRAGTRIVMERNGVVCCEAGATVAAVNEIANNESYCLPVVPGTGRATIGGCVANDVHGKNQWTHGSFGNHVKTLELERSDGTRWIKRDDPLFAATVGGLGLTGRITWVQIQLMRGRPFKPWLHPLDYVPYYWPLYKRLGFWQFHCVVNSQFWVPKIFDCLRQPPLLVVKKHFGPIRSIGMLSFCRPGVSLSFDFARKDPFMHTKLESAVIMGGGAVYPAKTAMSEEMFQFSFPRWKEFRAYIDPAFASSFSRRVGLTSGSTIAAATTAAE